MSAAAPDAVTRAALARARADARLLGAVDDLFLPDEARLTERERLAVGELLTRTVEEIEGELRRRVERSLSAERASGAPVEPSALRRLTEAGLLRDPDLIGALVTHVRHRALAAALPVGAQETEEASLLVRLAAVPDRMVASAARALLVADSATGVALPEPVRTRLVWLVAATLRAQSDEALADQALAEAASRLLTPLGEDEGAGESAMRLALAIDARAAELPSLLLEALSDRRLALFIAVTAHAMGLDYPEAEALVLDADGERLWLALRALRLDRPTIARIALALSDSDPRRDIEAFADRLDEIAAVDPQEARRALAPDLLAPAFRDAVRTLARAERS